MANCIKTIRTNVGDLPIDYTALENKPKSDTTLSVSGGFADAKIVGDKINDVLKDIEMLSENFESLIPEVVDNVTTTEPGCALDARQGKVLQEQINSSALNIDRNTVTINNNKLTTDVQLMSITADLSKIEDMQSIHFAYIWLSGEKWVEDNGVYTQTARGVKGVKSNSILIDKPFEEIRNAYYECNARCKVVSGENDTYNIMFICDTKPIDLNALVIILNYDPEKISWIQ